jgi:hypothetical protein
MPKKKKKKEEAPADFVYKSYDIRWLKGIGEEHPDFALVAEFEEKFGPLDGEAPVEAPVEEEAPAEEEAEEEKEE